MAILRGDVYFVELGPTRGRDIDTKRRPVVVVSADTFNALPLVVIVVPGSTLRRGRVPFLNEVRVDPTGENGLTEVTLFQCLQVKALDHSRFRDERVGVLSEEDLSNVDETLRLCLNLDPP